MAFGGPIARRRWLKAKTRRLPFRPFLRFLYAYEHGRRLSLPPMKAPVEKRFFKALMARQAVRWNSHADYPALELFAVEGTDASRSGVGIPISCR